MTLAPGTKVGPYEILARIGAGGMGEVWKARDTRLGRIVAIKKVKEQHSERFKQEARSIAALNHPNICQLFDIGPDYLVLEYVEGKSIPCPLPEREAVRLAIQIATALEEAHKKGILHRDIKPSNIMMTDEGSVKLLDFGLAKLYEQDAGSAGVPPAISKSPTAEFPATQAGAVLGTLAYMSPEQAQGQPADARSDIFSFGLLLYEMLSGRRAFSGDSTPAVMAALLRDEPLPLQSSPSLEKIVRRCLVKQPSGRYQTMSEVKAALDLLLADKVSAASAEPQPSIAVLPFVNMSGDKEQEYFSDGLAEEIINALAQIPGLKVIARTSSFSFRGKETDIGQIRDRLKVQNVLEGSVRRSGNRIRITAQLINTADESHLWSQRYDREMTDVFIIQDEISQAIAEKLRLRLAGGRPLVKGQTENLEAYNLCLKGRYHLFEMTPQSMRKSKECYEQALALDPNWSLAWNGLAFSLFHLGYAGSAPPKTTNAQAKRAALKALELDSRLPEAHATMGLLHAVGYDWINAELEFRRALEINPASAEVSALYDYYYLVPMRRLDEALAESRKALEVDPLSPFLHFRLGERYYLTQQWDRALEKFRDAFELGSYYFWAPLFTGVIYVGSKKFSEAIQAAEIAVRIEERSPILKGYLGWIYAKSGRTAEAQKLLSELHERARVEYVPYFSFLAIHLGLREIDMAFDMVEKAVEEREFKMTHLHVDPLFDPLRSHPRYPALLRKMNLEP